MKTMAVECRVRGSSVSCKWKCSECRHEFRTPTRAKSVLERKCKCGRRYFFTPGEAALEKGLESYVKFQSWSW
jgi:hypothetical protein